MKISLKNMFVSKNDKGISKTSLILVCAILTLCAFGCLMVYSASSYSAQKHYGNEYFFLIKHIEGVLIGIACMIFLRSSKSIKEM